MCSAWRSSLWRWDAAARKGPCEGHKGLADETGERVRFVVHCCWMRLALAVQLVLRYSGVSPGSPLASAILPQSSVGPRGIQRCEVFLSLATSESAR